MSHKINAFVVPAYEGSVASAAVHFPDGSSVEMTNMGSFFSLPSVPGQTVSLPGSARAGTYRFQINEAAGQEKLSVSLRAPAAGIPPVRVANYDEAQAVDAAQTFDVQWEKVARRGPKDYLMLDIYATDGPRVFNVSNISLDETNVTIPAGTLQPNSTNKAYLSLRHSFAHSSGAQPPHWLSEEDRVTRFTIKTLNPAGVLGFSPICVTANETDRVATITVHRRQGGNGEVTVDYFATDGTARSNVNYAPVSGGFCGLCRRRIWRQQPVGGGEWRPRCQRQRRHRRFQQRQSGAGERAGLSMEQHGRPPFRRRLQQRKSVGDQQWRGGRGLRGLRGL